MNSSSRPGKENSRCAGISFMRILLWLVFVALVSAWSLPGAETTNSLEIHYINVNGKPLSFRGRDSVNLGSHPENVVFGFGAATNGGKTPLRLRFMLDGYDTVWHEMGSEMSLTVRFYNNTGDQIGQNVYRVNGESTGWTGSLKNSQQAHRRETLVVPPQATRLLVVISSAGPPDAIGIYVVANLLVLKSSGSTGNVVLLQSPFDNDRGDHSNDDVPAGWMHDGTRPSMARIVKIGQDPQTKAFAILDEDLTSHGEWHNILQSAPVVTPGDSLVVEWNEMYSIGLGSFREASYTGLSAGNYRFRVSGVDVLGRLTGPEASVRIFIPEPVWKTPWFWGSP
jgi:hypothetical protein